MTITAIKPRVRLLVVPGLNGSPPEHWQSWLQTFHRDSVRVVQRDWQQADLERWAARIGSTVAQAGAGPWVAVAHSFGALALVQHLAATPASPIRAARWGGQVLDRGNAGHINVAAGFRTLPLARRWVQAAEQRLAREVRLARETHPDFGEWSFTV